MWEKKQCYTYSYRKRHVVFGRQAFPNRGEEIKKYSNQEHITPYSIFKSVVKCGADHVEHFHDPFFITSSPNLSYTLKKLLEHCIKPYSCNSAYSAPENSPMTGHMPSEAYNIHKYTCRAARLFRLADDGAYVVSDLLNSPKRHFFCARKTLIHHSATGVFVRTASDECSMSPRHLNAPTSFTIRILLLRSWNVVYLYIGKRLSDWQLRARIVWCTSSAFVHITWKWSARSDRGSVYRVHISWHHANLFALLLQCQTN